MLKYWSLVLSNFSVKSTNDSTVMGLWLHWDCLIKWPAPRSGTLLICQSRISQRGRKWYSQKVISDGVYHRKCSRWNQGIEITILSTHTSIPLGLNLLPESFFSPLNKSQILNLLSLCHWCLNKRSCPINWVCNDGHFHQLRSIP